MLLFHRFISMVYWLEHSACIMVVSVANLAQLTIAGPSSLPQWNSLKQKKTHFPEKSKKGKATVSSHLFVSLDQSL